MPAALVSLGAVAAATWLRFDVSPWNVVFIATAAISLRFLWLGTCDLLDLLREASGVVTPFDLRSMVARRGVVLVAVYAAGWVAFARKVTRSGLQLVESRQMIFAAVILLAIEVGLYDVNHVLIASVGLGAAGGLTHLVHLGAIQVLTSVTVLFVQFHLLLGGRLSTEKGMLERILADERRQYELSSANLEALNLRLHDLKQQVRDGGVGRGFAESVRRDASTRDAFYRTGNRALDTILTEKHLAALECGATLSCIVDGAALAPMEEGDIYSFFGNALDNALEAVAGLDATRDRTVVVDVRRRGSMAVVHLENPCGEAVFKGIMPLTGKRDGASHGWGTKSMREVVRRYGGTMTLVSEKGRFSVNALLPAG